MMGCGGMRYFLGVLLVREIPFFQKKWGMKHLLYTMKHLL